MATTASPTTSDDLMKVTSSDLRALLSQVKTDKAALLLEIEELKSALTATTAEITELDEQQAAAEISDGGESKAASKAAKVLFNEKPKKGMKALFECGEVEETAEGIAKYLYETPNLSKKAVGEYLGENEGISKDVLAAFSAQHEMAGLDFDKALRTYLWSFRLPGESQKIDRMMEAFASRFLECNPGSFTNADTAYVLAFATIMLNTSLHNPSVKSPMTLEQFLSMNRGIDHGQDLPEEFLKTLYSSIKTNEFKIPDSEEDGIMEAFVNPERSGYLVKEGGSHKNWKKRWFTLCNSCLYYFENEAATKPKGTIPLENLIVRELPDQKKKNCFEILYQGSEDTIKAAKTKGGKIVQARADPMYDDTGKHNSYKIQAKDQEEMMEWIKSIRAAMMDDPIYKIFMRRKANAIASY